MRVAFAANVFMAAPAETSSSRLGSNFLRYMILVRNIKHHLQWVVTLSLSGLVMLLAPVGSYAQTTLGTQTLSLTLHAAGLLYTVPASVTLTHVGTTFTTFTGSVTLDYRARTTTSTGSGTITAKATTDFPCASGGPCIATPPSAGDALTYTCSGATLGASCSGTQTVSTTAATNVVTIPAGACTGAGSPCGNAATNTVSVNFKLTDDPKYKTGGPYSATLTWTISAA
ncbi:MAG: hypothetical protein ABSF45_20230 [Terriglobia bacterium]